MSSDKLAEVLWPDGINLNPKIDEDKDYLAESLQKALDNTTPERAGAPWDNEEVESERPRGYFLPEGR